MKLLDGKEYEKTLKELMETPFGGCFAQWSKDEHKNF